MIELTDSVITIRPYTMKNAQEHLDGEDEELVKWLSGEKGTLQGVQKWIQKNQEYWINDGPVYNFGIFDNENQLVGMVEANTDYQSVEGINAGNANISYGLFPKERGEGYVTRAVDLISKFLTSKGIKHAIIRVDPNNISSLKVPERCGFTQERTITSKEGKQLIIFSKKLVRASN